MPFQNYFINSREVLVETGERCQKRMPANRKQQCLFTSQVNEKAFNSAQSTDLKEGYNSGQDCTGMEERRGLEGIKMVAELEAATPV